MSKSRLIALTYYDPGKSVRLTVYADTVILDRSGNDSVISAIRFGGYPEVVRAMSDAIYGGATIEMPWNGQTRQLKSVPKQYRRQMSHDGLYAVGTLMVDADTMQAKAMKLMASKLAVAGIIEGNLSEEGLAAMSDVKDLTSQMAKELALTATNLEVTLKQKLACDTQEDDALVIDAKLLAGMLEKLPALPVRDSHAGRRRRRDSDAEHGKRLL